METGLRKNRQRNFSPFLHRSTENGKRDYAIPAFLVRCALRRRKLAWLTVEEIQMRENRWVIADLRGKGGRVRTVAVPMRVKQGINAWQAAGGVEEGPLFRPSVREARSGTA